MFDLSQNGYTHDEIVSILLSPAVFHPSYQLYVVNNRNISHKLNLLSMYIECDKEDSVKYGGTFSFELDDEINWNSDRLQPYMSMWHDNMLFAWPLTPPLYVPKDNDEISENIIIANVEAYDESSFLRGNNLEKTLTYSQGTPYLSIFSDIFDLANFTDHLISPTDKILQADREFEEGTEILELINELLQEINYINLEPDLNGIFSSEEYTEPYSKTPTIHYQSGNENVIQSPISRIKESRDKHNVFIGYYTNAETGESWREVSENDSPSSPLSITNIGYRITAAPERFDNVADEQTLHDLVYRKMQEETLSHLQYQFSTVPLPHHGVGDIIAIDNELLSGTFEEIYWSINVNQTGSSYEQSMTHKVRSLYYD